MSFRELSIKEMSVGGIVRSGNCPSGNYPLGNCPSGKCLRGTVRWGNVRREKACWGNVCQGTVRILKNLWCDPLSARCASLLNYYFTAKYFVYSFLFSKFCYKIGNLLNITKQGKCYYRGIQL